MAVQIKPDPHNLGFDWIMTFVVGQLIVITILGIGTMILLRYRKLKKNRIDAHKIEYGAKIADAVALGVETIDITKPNRMAIYRRHALKEVLQENIISIMGVERAMLVDAYINLGCIREDEWALSSFRWWVRLQALSNLSLLRRNELAPLFESMRSDGHPLVASAALIGLSQLNDRRNNPPAILARLPKSFVQNVNLLLELSNNWSALYGTKWLGDYIRRNPQTKTARSLIAVLISLRTAEATDLILETMDSRYHIRHTNPVEDDAERRLIQRMRRAILETSDPVAIKRLRKIEKSRSKVDYDKDGNDDQKDSDQDDVGAA